jgi:sulfur-oxidizing protein SoxY
MRPRTRRRFITALAGLGALPLLPATRGRAAETNDLAPLIEKITAGKPVSQQRVVVDTPRLADNGHSVPLKLSVESPMTAADHVVAITLLSERNPRPVIATYHLGPRSGKAVVATRVRLNGTQRLVAIARLSDGSFWSGSAEVVVTESACLDES